MILLYHNLVPDNAPSGYKLTSITLRQAVFEQHIAWLSRYFEIVSLEVYLSTAKERLGRKIAVTFDDGTATSFACAFPVLQKFKVPATFFVTTCHLDGGSLMPGCFLNAVFYEEIYPEMVFNGSHFSLEMPNQRKQARSLAGRMVKESKDPMGFVREMEKTYPLPADVRKYYQGMTLEQLKIAANSALVEIGAHTVTHPDLSSLPSENQRWEIAESKRVLEELTGKSVRYFAYPSGQYARTTIELVKDAGYQAAFATIPKYFGDEPAYEVERIGIYSPSIMKLMFKVGGVVNFARHFGLKVG